MHIKQQKQRTENSVKRKAFEKITAVQSKRIGKGLLIRENWDNIKISVMRELIQKKFMISTFREKLNAINNDLEIVEENYWGDTFCGTCKGKGQNILGKLIQEQRE